MFPHPRSSLPGISTSGRVNIACNLQRWGSQRRGIVGEGLKAERVGGAGDEAGGTQAKRGRNFSGEGAEGILLPRSEDLILALTAPGLRGAGGRVGIREGLTRSSGAPGRPAPQPCRSPSPLPRPSSASASPRHPRAHSKCWGRRPSRARGHHPPGHRVPGSSRNGRHEGPQTRGGVFLSPPAFAAHYSDAHLGNITINPAAGFQISDCDGDCWRENRQLSAVSFT